MKLIRLTDDRYVLDSEMELTQEESWQISEYWKNWWATELTTPGIIVFNGKDYPLTYEDRREPDIEARLQFLENHVHGYRTSLMSGPPLRGEEHGEEDKD